MYNSLLSKVSQLIIKNKKIKNNKEYISSHQALTAVGLVGLQRKIIIINRVCVPPPKGMWLF